MSDLKNDPLAQLNNDLSYNLQKLSACFPALRIDITAEHVQKLVHLIQLQFIARDALMSECPVELTDYPLETE